MTCFFGLVEIKILQNSLILQMACSVIFFFPSADQLRAKSGKTMVVMSAGRA
jgi:hypothetical protein